MDRLRIALNIVLALAAFTGAIYLLGQDSFVLVDRWNHTMGTLFQGLTLYCLAFGLLFLGSFAGVVGYSWAKSILPTPSKDRIRPHPAYKGMVIVRFWYLLLPAGPAGSSNHRVSSGRKELMTVILQLFSDLPHPRSM